MKKGFLFSWWVLGVITLNPLLAEESSTEVDFGMTAEAGVVLAGGNSRSQTVSLKSDAKWLWQSDSLKGFASFLTSKASNTQAGSLTKNAENWLLGARYERALSDRFGVYLGNSWQGDRFAGFDYRTNIDVGGQYYLIPGDKKVNYWVTELGYRYSYEKQNTGSTFDAHAVRVYTEGVYQFGQGIVGKLWVEFLPDMGNSDNILLNFEPSLSVVLSDLFSLKLALLGKYDGLPAVAGNKKFDYIYTTSLVANF